MPPAADRPRGLLLDIGGTVHATGIQLAGRLAIDTARELLGLRARRG